MKTMLLVLSMCLYLRPVHTVQYVDNTGNSWAASSSKVLVMHNNLTPDIYDDIIVGVID